MHMRKKRFRNIVFLFIIAIILVAFFTRPGLEQFKDYQPSVATVKTPPVIDYENRFLYSRFTVTYYTAQPAAGEKPGVAVPYGKDTYIGLFGRFWKMD